MALGSGNSSKRRTAKFKNSNSPIFLLWGLSVKGNMKAKGFRKEQILDRKLLKRMIREGAEGEDLEYLEEEE